VSSNILIQGAHVHGDLQRIAPSLLATKRSNEQIEVVDVAELGPAWICPMDWMDSRPANLLLGARVPLNKALHAAKYYRKN